MSAPAHPQVQRQIVLPLSKAIEIAYKSIRLRLSRSLLVTSGIVLALAFLMSILTTEAIVRHLRIHCEPGELIACSTRLIEMNVLNLVIRNADAHAKNYAMLYTRKQDAILAPVYDVLTVAAYPEYARNGYGLSIGGRKAWNLRKELERLNDGRESPGRGGLVEPVLAETPCRLGAAQSRLGRRHQASAAAGPTPGSRRRASPRRSRT